MQNRNLFPQLLNAHNCSYGVELGVFRGEFSKILLDGWTGTLYLVDIWRNLPIEEYDDITNQKKILLKFILKL